MEKGYSLKDIAALFACSWLLVLAAIVFWLVVPGATAILGSYGAAKLRARTTRLVSQV